MTLITNDLQIYQQSQSHRFLLFDCISEEQVHATKNYDQKDTHNPDSLLFLSLCLNFSFYHLFFLLLLLAPQLFNLSTFLFFSLSNLVLVLLFFPQNLFFLPFLFHFYLLQPLFLLLRFDLIESLPLSVSDGQVDTKLLPHALYLLGNCLQIFNGCLVQSSVSQIILMINEKLAIDSSQKLILYQFLKNGYYKTTTIMLYCKNQASVAILVESFGIFQAQFFEKEVEIIFMACDNRQIQEASKDINRLIYIKPVCCQTFEDVFMGLIAQSAMKHCLALVVLSSEVYIQIQKFTNYLRIIQPYCHLQRGLSFHCSDFQICARPGDQGLKKLVLIVLDSDVQQSPA